MRQRQPAGRLMPAVASRAFAAAAGSPADAPMFDKILVANRGEIAIRVMRTARRLGIKTVAIHSEIDANSQHVLAADEAYNIGPAPAAESYLVGERILEVCERTGAQAVHPGYGFLSENAQFSEACAANGVTFIGPPSQAIVDMGSKSASKNIMINAGVPVTPGYHGDEQSPEHLMAQAEEMGFPVMIKAVLGGGGKGMRMVETADDFYNSLEMCQREAMKSFSDDRVLIERFLTKPRHVELQVFADTHGNAVHLFERDCSLQRRHQKVLEEAPAPGLSHEQRMRMGKAATDAARAVGYVGAGTVEFLLDDDGESFYFMEMNTRLQVEHPVSEMVTGHDFVEWQLRIAAGEKLPLTQEELGLNGHAIEARIYAENPDNNFLPGSGRLHFIGMPEHCSFDRTQPVRIDTGIVQGDDVSIYYDPMISKLIVHGQDRKEALRLLDGALADYRIVGLPTNIEFVRRCASHPSFVEGELDINFIEKFKEDLLPSIAAPSTEVTMLTALAQLLHEMGSRSGAEVAGATHTQDSANTPWASQALSGIRIGKSGGQERKLVYKCQGEDVEVGVTYVPGTESCSFEIDVDGITSQVQGSLDEDGNLVATIDGQRHCATVVRHASSWHVFHDGERVVSGRGDQRHLYVYEVPVADYASGGAGGGSTAITTPMPGKVVKLMAEKGEAVEKGQPLLILEAMKMEHVIRAPADAVVDRLPFAVGDQVDDGQVLVGFADE